ncbi:NTP transferase domain-containing protein [Deinococcus sonorensis]|uniref:NTP transferase domain-containing protein n=1 Tax=Deinococcus sonorensis TaxID=309891 RepID=A0ABV8Y926_9DEIO
MAPAETWNALVLGGGDPGDPFAAAHGVKVKPQIQLEGRPMAGYVLQALRDSGRVAQVAYVGPVPDGQDAGVDLRLTDHGSLLANLEGGARALAEHSGTPHMLVVTADIPLITAQMVQDVLDSAPDAGLVYPIVRREVCEAAYPGVKRTYARLQDGTFTGGNLFLLDARLISRVLPRLREVLATRKQPLKLASLIGYGVLLRLLLGQLSIQQLETRVSALLEVPARALITEHAAIGTDVDKDGDLELVTRVLSARGGPASR